ncbi:DUF2637 domain-containing protein [Dermacoccus nishinomiyaensis]
MNRARRWAVLTAAAGTVFIAAGAFWLSFTSLADLARRSGIGAGQAWAWPLIVDGIIVVATVAVVALAGTRAAWYPWALLAGGAIVSVTANAIHAVLAAESTVPGILAAAVAAVPPVVLLAITHLTVILGRPTSEPVVKPGDEVPLLTDAIPDEQPRPLASPPESRGQIPAPAPSESTGPDAQDSGDEPIPTSNPTEPEPTEHHPPTDVLTERTEATDAPETGPTPQRSKAAPGAGAARRERAAELKATGWSNKRIARELGVHPSTVGRWFTPHADKSAAPDDASEADVPAGRAPSEQTRSSERTRS